MSVIEDDLWDRDSDEIRSLNSEYLHEARPNRWTGAEATWRDLTAEDRQAHASLVGERNRDLGIHLYNAFGLKRHGISGVQGEEEEEEEDEDKAWTSWPMRLKDVPTEDFMRTGELHNAETFCRPRSPNPAGELEEEISAAILRLAKERLRKRQEQAALLEVEGEQDYLPADPNVEPSIEVGLEQHDEEEVMEMELDDTGSDSHSEDEDEDEDGYHTHGIRAAISADDDASYAMLQPSARHILSQLDRTLTILHNTRMAMFSYLSDSDAEDDKRVSHTKRKRTPNNNQTDAEGQGGRRRRLGRPPKAQVPREGETEREMLIRIAREKKKRLPVFSDEENDTPASDSKTRGRRRKAQRQPRQVPNERQDTGGEAPRPSHSDEGEQSKDPVDDPERRFDKLGLRDWRDVLGAAVMAGFSSKVIARASQRCANLFEQRIEFKTLAEYPAAHGTRRMHTARYKPGEEISSAEEEDKEEAAMTEVEQRRAVSRASSVAVGSSSSSEEEEGKMARKPGTKKRNEMTSVGQLYCPYPGCSRSVQGFNRKGNLNRHLDTMHEKDSMLGHMNTNTDNEDHSNEVHGAVHVDGFLKPIKMQKGWREGDTKVRPRRPNDRNKTRRQSRRATPRPDDDGYTAERGEDELVKYEGLE